MPEQEVAASQPESSSSRKQFFPLRDAIALIKDLATLFAMAAGGFWAVFTLIDNRNREDDLFRSRAIAASDTCAMSIVGEADDYYIVRSHLQLTSRSKIRFYVFESPYAIYGNWIPALSVGHRRPELIESARKHFAADQAFADRTYASSRDGIPLEYGRIVDVSSSSLEPGESISFDTESFVSKNMLKTFSLLTFSTQFVLAEKLDRLGTALSIDESGKISLAMTAYTNPKSNMFSRTADGPGTTVSAAGLRDPQVAPVFGKLNVVVYQTGCSLVSPYRGSNANFQTSKQ